MTKKTYELTEAEWTIIEAIWENEPCAAPTIQEVLEKEKGWSYSTVKTFMDRMVAKGLLSTRRIRNLILYSAAITAEQAQKREVRRTLKRAFGGAFTPMMQFMLDDNALSARELGDLEVMIRRRRRRDKPDAKR